MTSVTSERYDMIIYDSGLASNAHCGHCFMTYTFWGWFLAHIAKSPKYTKV